MQDKTMIFYHYNCFDTFNFLDSISPDLKAVQKLVPAYLKAVPSLKETTETIYMYYVA
jgi:hypothetical protein